MRYFFLLLFVCSLASCAFEQESVQTVFRKPINPGTKVIHEETGLEGKERRAWFERMHRAAEGIEWRKVEYQNRKDLVTQKSNLKSGGSFVSVEDGLFTGFWEERGSTNQAGSVYETDYDPKDDKIYLVSAGGSIWRGNRNGTGWEVLNQDFRFTRGFFEFFEFEGQKRMIAEIQDVPHISLDEGLTWLPIGGIDALPEETYNSSLITLGDENPEIFFLSTPSSPLNWKLYRSTNGGGSFEMVQELGAGLERYVLDKPKGSDELFMLKKEGYSETGLYQWDANTLQLEVVNIDTDFNMGSASVNLHGTTLDNGDLRFYAYTQIGGQPGIYKTDDLGANWTYQGEVPIEPWSVGIFVSEENPNLLVTGGVNCYRSNNGGQSWTLQNEWWEYYDDLNTLHADIMYIEEFKTIEGDYFILNSNHGGLHVSYNQHVSLSNVSLDGLNVSQYYSVKTDPVDPTSAVYAGTQDQGLQFSWDMPEDGPWAFDQVLSGDYGQIVFSNDGRDLWTVYPDGVVDHWPDAADQAYWAGSYEIDSQNESVWLPPLMSDPDPAAEFIYAGGGSATGGAGSYIMKIEPYGGGAENLPYNFSTESNGGAVSAMAFSGINNNRWYVATDNGRFFYSEDRGATWEKTDDVFESSYYLYGQAILPSKLSEFTVYLGGSGYSNPPVLKSEDGGQTFTPMSEGLPSTLVYGLASNTFGTRLFAATENGPYVYLLEKESWYPLGGTCAPIQTYWSVEYVDELSLARFGTYGRGAWDFAEAEITGIEDGLSLQENEVNIYPNPSNGQFHVDVPDTFSLARTTIYNLEGKLVHSQDGARLDFDLGLPSGQYVLNLEGANGEVLKKTILLK